MRRTADDVSCAYDDGSAMAMTPTTSAATATAATAQSAMAAMTHELEATTMCATHAQAQQEQSPQQLPRNAPARHIDPVGALLMGKQDMNTNGGGGGGGDACAHDVATTRTDADTFTAAAAAAAAAALRQQPLQAQPPPQQQQQQQQYADVACDKAAVAPTSDAAPRTQPAGKEMKSSGNDNNNDSSSEADDVAVLAAAAAAYTRPATALTVHLVTLYKLTKAMHCVQCRRAMPEPRYNKGYASKEGHYHVLLGEAIAQRYYVQEVLGRGSFGTVVRCYDEKRHMTVALKITRLGAGFRTQAKVELDILLKLNANASLDHLVVKLLKAFDWQGHIVLVFELLSFNLYELIKCTRYHGVSLDLVRKFAYQLMHTLLQLELHQPPIIHCDLKPENIMLKNQSRSGIRLIDFGSACYVTWVPHVYIQSRFYRSPEVILRLKYGTAIDRWSLACVLVELHTGVPLFDGTSEAAQLARFTAMLGPLPHDMLARSPVVHKFYNGSHTTSYTLKGSDGSTDGGGGSGSGGHHHRGSCGCDSSGVAAIAAPMTSTTTALPPSHTLASVLGVTTGGPRGSRRGTPGHDEAAYIAFHSFIAQLLRYDPSQRMSCRDALRHPFLAQLATTTATTTTATTATVTTMTTAAAATTARASSTAAATTTMCTAPASAATALASATQLAS